MSAFPSPWLFNQTSLCRLRERRGGGWWGRRSGSGVSDGSGGGGWWGRRSWSGVSDGSGWAGVWFQVQLKLYIYHTPVKERIRVDQKVAEEAEADS